MFNFFQLVPTAKVSHKNNIVLFCYNSKYKIFFYGNGDVQILEGGECTIFKIEDKVKSSCVPEGCNVLITLCECLDKCVLKVFNLTKFVKKAPSLINTTVLENISNVTTISAFCLINTDLCFAIGLQNGYVLLCKSQVSKEIPPKAFKCLNVCSKPVKGIQFSNSTDGNINMFICSDDGVFYYKISSSTILNETIFSLDDIVSSVHCCTLQPMLKFNNGQNFIVARDDGLYYYSTEGRGSCYALNGKKKFVEWFGKKYILILNTISEWNLDDNTYQLIVIDIHNKIIVFNKELCNIVGIQTIHDSSNCLIFLRNGDIMTLREKGIRYKIKHLISKNLYDVALKLLEDSNTNSEIFAEVLVSYGDHLLQRGDMFGAVNMYSKTIGIVSPFTIVNKLTDFRYNECLIEYLSQLNETEFKSSEHARLLKNCRQRTELTLKTFHIFESANEECDKLIACYSTVDQTEKYSSLSRFLDKKENFLTYIKKIAVEDIVDFFSEYGYFLINQYPDYFVEAAKYTSKSSPWTDNCSFYKIIFPLLLSNKSFAIDFIDNVCKQYKPNYLYNIWTELVLQMWQLGNVDIEFVINFFEANGPNISMDNAFLICRNYEFWPGIRFLYDKCSLQILSVKCLAKCFEMYPDYVNDFSNEFDFNSTQMWIRSLAKDKLFLKYSLKLVAEIFKRVTQTRPYYILNIVGGFDIGSNFFVSHTSDFFLSCNIFQYFKSTKLHNKVILLEQKVAETKTLLQKYNNRPMEFRSRSCDICKQMTKLPMLYFICQHSFHKECVRQYSDSLECVVCSNKKKTIIIVKPRLQIPKISGRITLLQDISEKLKENILNINTFSSIESSKRQPNPKSLNPFESCNDEYEYGNNFISKYDNNLNPFNVIK